MRRLLALSTTMGALGLLSLPAQAATPRDARSFVDSIGVNVHLYYTDTVYNDYPLIKSKLQWLGVRHVRDQCDPLHRQTTFDRINDLGASGIKMNWIAGRPPTGPDSELDRCVSDAKNKIRGAVESLEGPNEWDNQGRANWVEEDRTYTSWLRQLAHGDAYGSPIRGPLIAPSVIRPQAHGSLGDLTPNVDRGNIHSYPGGQPPHLCNYGRTFDGCLSDARINAPGKTVTATETGYQDATNCDLHGNANSGGCGGHHPTSREASAVYAPRMLLEYHKRGVDRTYWYELIDQFSEACYCSSEKHFGLFWNDGNPKPQATAIRNTIALLDGPASGTLIPVGYSLSGPTGDPDGAGSQGAIRDYLLQKADGSWWLALWPESSVWNRDNRTMIDNPSRTVTVSLDRTVSGITGYRPTNSTSPIGSLGPTSTFNVGLDDDVVLVKLQP